MPKKKNTHSPTTSVIIPAYNAEKTLQHCLDALHNQTRIPDEIIVVDDGSTDQTKTVAEAFSLVTVLSQKNQGPAKARNVGAQKAHSDIIIFIDSDCIADKNWLEEMLKPFADEKVVGVQGAYRTQQSSFPARFDQADIEYRYERMKKQTKLDWIGSYSAAYRRTIFMQEKGFDETFPRASGEDPELSYRLAEKGMKLQFAPTAIVFHTHPETVVNYLKVKFFRAYWRTRMYLKHPQKSIKDSYTPNALKLNFFLGGLFFLLILILLTQPFVLPAQQSFLRAEVENVVAYLLICFLLIVFVMWDFILWLVRKDWTLVLPGIGLIFLRSLTFVLGAGMGLLDRRVRE